jgi:hypothetical protein
METISSETYNITTQQCAPTDEVQTKPQLLEGAVYKQSKKQEIKTGRDFRTVQKRISHTDMARNAELGEWCSLRACYT